MSSKGKKFIKPIKLFRLGKNREGCRVLKKAKGCPGEGEGDGRVGTGQGAHQEEDKDEANWRAVREGGCFGSSVACPTAAADPIFPQSIFSSGLSNTPRELIQCWHKPI